jgi:hypothetical protein
MHRYIERTSTGIGESINSGILDRVPRWLLAFLVGFTPALLTLALIGGYLKRSLFDFRPTRWSDQVYYWHQILTFSQVGFNGGNYMFYERPPSIDFFRFGASGFVFPSLYGTLGRILGWETYTGILFNMLAIALAIWVIIYIAKLDRIQILLTGLFLLSIWPVLLNIPTIMQESLHQAAGLVLAALFYRLLRRDMPRWLFVTGIVFLGFISLIRFSWVLLFLPFFVLSLKKWTWPRLVGASIASGMIAVFIVMVFQSTSAPGNNSIFARVGMLSSSPVEGIQVILNSVKVNIENMLRIDDIHSIDLNKVEFVQFFVLLFGLGLGGQLFLSEKSPSKISFELSRLWLFHLYNLVSILAASLTFYLSNGYLRVLAPYILLSGMLLIAFKHFRLVIILIVIGLFGSGIFLNTYSDEFSANFFQYTPEQIEKLKAPFEHYLVYEEQANSWCNTVLTQASFLDNRVTFVPAGIGISFFVAVGDQPFPIKSQYLMLDPLSYEVLHTHVNLTLLANISGGKLYRNMDVDCGGQ